MSEQQTSGTGDVDPFEHDDAAYVLGALDASDAEAFEAHLASCSACRHRVAGARETMSILGRPAADPSAAGAKDKALPDTVLPALVREVRRRQRRQRVLNGGLAAATAACLVALVIAVWPSSGHTAAQPPAQALAPVGHTAPIRASAQFVDHRWGTAIDLHCKYAKGFYTDIAYYLEVVDSDGTTHDAGSWKLSPGGATDFVGGTEVRYARIKRVQVTLPNGQAVLQLAVH